MAAILFLFMPKVFPGGYILVSNTGIPFRHDISKPISIDFDDGPYGTLSSSQAIDFAMNAINIWSGANEPTLELRFTINSTGALSNDGDVDTVEEFNAIFSTADDKSPVVFDADGSLFTDLGLPNGVIGFATIEAIDIETSKIIETFQAYNGNLIDGDSSDGLEAPLSVASTVITHEMGHALNFGHSQVNGTAFIGDTDDPGFTIYGLPPEGEGTIEIMFPILIGGGNNATSPTRDDLSTAEFIYGNDTRKKGFISGQVFRKNKITPVRGANIIARNTDDPFGDAVSNVSGGLFFPNRILGSGPTPPELQGSYTIRGLTSGANYTVEKVQINPRFTAGSGVPPISPPISIAEEEFYNGDNEGAKKTEDRPLDFESIDGTASTGIDFICNEFKKAIPGICYASTGFNVSSPGSLLNLDLETGDESIIGRTNQLRIAGLAINQSGEIFGSTGGLNSRLVRIDAETGDSFVLGTIVRGRTNIPLGFVKGIAFNNNNVLFGIDRTNTLYVINQVNASARKVLRIDVHPEHLILTGLTFNPEKDVFVASGTGQDGRNSTIIEINLSSSRTRHIGNVGRAGESIQDLHFLNGTLFGISSSNFEPSSNIIKIDQATGRGTVVGVVEVPAVTGLSSRTIFQSKTR